MRGSHHACPAPRLEGDPSRIEWAESQASGTLSRLRLVGLCRCDLQSPESLLSPAEQDLDLPWTFWGALQRSPHTYPQEPRSPQGRLVPREALAAPPGLTGCGPQHRGQRGIDIAEGMPSLPVLPNTSLGVRGNIKPQRSLPPHHTKWDRDLALCLLTESLISQSLLEPMTHSNCILFSY